MLCLSCFLKFTAVQLRWCPTQEPFEFQVTDFGLAKFVIGYELRMQR